MTNPRLTAELVPSTCWFTNVRSEITEASWEWLKKVVFKRAKYRCEVCGGQGPKWPVECHELWAFDDVKKTQTLWKFVALCPNCHMCKHFGLAGIRGQEDDVIAHFMKVNGWSATKTRNYLEAQFEQYQERSLYQWTLDIERMKQVPEIKFKPKGERGGKNKKEE